MKHRYYAYKQQAESDNSVTDWLPVSYMNDGLSIEDALQSAQEFARKGKSKVVAIKVITGNQFWGRKEGLND